MTAVKWIFLLIVYQSVAKAAVMREHDGRLTTASGTAVRGPVDLEVSLYRKEEGGDPLLPTPLSFNGVPLNDGYFRIRVELSDADSLIAFGARGDAKVWVQILDQTHDRVYPRQLMTGTAEVITAITPPVDPNTGVLAGSMAAPRISTSSATDSTRSTQSATEQSTTTDAYSAPELSSIFTSTDTVVTTATLDLTSTDFGTSSELSTTTSPNDQHSASDDRSFIELTRTTFIESPLSTESAPGRAELGTTGRCGSTPDIGGEVRFHKPFMRRPYIFLSPGDAEDESCKPRIISRDLTGFVWSSGSGLQFLGGCSCIEWMAVGL